MTLLSSLREPPVIGRFYSVPAVRFNWCGVEALWPVLGPMHTDKEFLNFDKPHYHVDARFVSKALARRIGDDIFSMAQRFPLAQRRRSKQRLPSGRPAMHRMKCQIAEFPYRHHDKPTISALRIAYGDVSPARRPSAIFLADGRALCPHRKVDLTQFRPDADGLVTCPLHGLRVRCTRDSDRSGEASETQRGSTAGESAGLQGIANPAASPTPHTIERTEDERARP